MITLTNEASAHLLGLSPALYHGNLAELRQKLDTAREAMHAAPDELAPVGRYAEAYGAYQCEMERLEGEQ